MRKFKHRFILFTILILSILLLFSGWFIYHQVQEDKEPVISSALLVNQIQDANELITTKYVYTHAGSYENQHDFYGWKIPFTRSHFVVAYDGTLAAGVDVNEITVRVANKNIRIDLPDAEILSHDIDFESIRVLAEDSSVFNQIEIKDYQTFAINQEKEVEANAIDKGLLTLAQENAEKAITTLLKTDPLVAEGEYNISFE